MAPSQFLTGLMGTTDKSHGHFWGFLEKQVQFLFLNPGPTHNTQTGTQLLQEPGPRSWGETDLSAKHAQAWKCSTLKTVPRI